MDINWQGRFENNMWCPELDMWIDAAAVHDEDNSWITAMPFESFWEPEYDESLRTSTPEPSSSAEDMDDSQDSYVSFKNHLYTSMRKEEMQIRGVSFEIEDIICGHLDMNKQEDDYDDEYPLLNKCFVNMLINGPPPLVHPEEKLLHNVLNGEVSLYPCDCATNIAKNVNLPIGYKYNDDGIAIHVASSTKDKTYYRDPARIYTV